jgi:hypothetical protein
MNDAHPSSAAPFREALQRLGGDRELLQTMAAIFVDDAPELLKKLQGEIEAESFAAAAQTAHGLKGLIVTYDTDYAGVILQELVTALRTADRPRIAHLLPRTTQVTESLLADCRRLVD